LWIPQASTQKILQGAKVNVTNRQSMFHFYHHSYKIVFGLIINSFKVQKAAL